jgi:hypothetical protein
VPATLSWLDHDEAERRRMQEVIELFRERDTVDELGIGSVRDAFANLLFPGTSVLHTRARYLLFIPWIYGELERQHTPSSQIGPRARRDEIRLIYALIEGGEVDGVIGAVARDRLKLLPSYAYWNALEVFGIRRYRGSIDRYHRSLDSHYAVLRDQPRAEGDEPIDGPGPNWDPGLPPTPEGLLESTTFTLTRGEALYLRERIRTAAPGSLLDLFANRARPARHVGFPWRHPDVAKLPSEVAERLQLARVFSEVMLGASLLYNLMLAEERPLEARAREYRARLEEWAGDIAVPPDWSWDEFWAVALLSNPRIPLTTRRFIEQWFALVSEGRTTPDEQQGRSLMRDRERVTKGSQARLHNRRALELWGGSSGAAQLSFRWPIVEQVVNDILRGVSRERRSDARA